MFASAVLQRDVWVSAVFTWAFPSSTRVEGDVMRFVLYLFLASFPYKLANLILLYHLKCKSFASLKKGFIGSRLVA
jgi:hypothetical protein